MEKFKFKLDGLYTIIYSESSNTYLDEIAIVGQVLGRPYYQVVRRFRSEHQVKLGKMEPLPVPMGDYLRKWLVFEGHNLGFVINSRGIVDYRQKIRLVTSDIDNLRTVIQTRCLNPSVSGFANISAHTNPDDWETGVMLFPPQRELHSIRLYEERLAYPGIYYGISSDGSGCLYDNKIFYATAYLFNLSGGNYRVNIHHNPFHPDRIFNRHGYKTQDTANKALLFHANRIFKPLPTTKASS